MMHIPAWNRSTLARVHCCLRCCLQHWAQRLGLDENEKHWRKLGVDFWVSTGAGTRDAAAGPAPDGGGAMDENENEESVLLARFALARYAHVQAITYSDWVALVQPLDLAAPSTSPGGAPIGAGAGANRPPAPPSSASAPAATITTTALSTLRRRIRRALERARAQQLAPPRSPPPLPPPPSPPSPPPPAPPPLWARKRLLAPRFVSPSAASANATLIFLNGWGFGENVSLGETNVRQRTLTHRVAHRGHRFVFRDPVPGLFHALQRGRGVRHVVHYGNDHSISEHTLRGFYRARLGGHLHRYSAPNFAPAASRLPFALPVPLGLNSNAQGAMRRLLRENAELHVSVQHRRPQLLCCCMKPWKHRLRVVRTLQRNGFQCELNETHPWQETMELYLRHRFVLAIWGNGHNDFRVWEALSAGAVPVVQHFDEQNQLFDGLPVVRVRDWSALTPALLEREWQFIQEGVQRGSISWTKLFLPYWFHEHTAHMHEDAQ